MHINSFVLYRKKRSSSIGILHNPDVHFLCILHNCIFLLRSKRASRNEMPFYSININCEPIRSGKTASEETSSDLHADVPGTPDSSAQVADGNTVTHAVNIALLLSDRSRDKADAVDHIVALDLFH